MKAPHLLTLAGISLLTMSNSCRKEEVVSPSLELTTGRLVRIEMTSDAQYKNPRPRWIVDIAPDSLPGFRDKLYQQVKVFDLPDTAVYKAGRTITFHYHLVPYAQQSAWKTFVETHFLGPMPYWTLLLPELAISDVHLASSH
jgi:hypothetical protein